MNSLHPSDARVLPLWDFSVSLYSQPGMESLCLRLQDERDFNVILLLWAVWLDQQQLPYLPDLWRSGQVLAEQWQRWRVKPWRSWRRALPKRWPWLGLRQWVKRAELDAEHQLLSRLERMTRDTLQKNAPVRKNTVSGPDQYASQLLSIEDPNGAQLQHIVQRWRQT